MIGPATRLITEDKINNTVCNHCGTKNSLTVRVYSTFFMLKILPFVYGKKIEVECSHCHKISENDLGFESGTKLRIQAAKETAQHKWFLYLGYVFIGVVMIIGLTRPPSSY